MIVHIMTYERSTRLFAGGVCPLECLSSMPRSTNCRFRSISAVAELFADPATSRTRWAAASLQLRVLGSAAEGKRAMVAREVEPSDRNDFLLKPLRGTPEFSQLLSAAKECQDNFLSARAQPSH